MLIVCFAAFWAIYGLMLFIFRERVLLEILETIKPGADFAASTDFIEEHLLESMEILQLVSELNDEFDINITLPYIKPENFKSVESIYHMVQEILEDE